MIRIVSICCIWITILSVTALHRPNYILPCSRSQNFSACAMDHAKIAIPHLLNGDRRLRIPSMNPLKITLVDLEGADNFHMVARNIKVYGLGELEPLSLTADFDTHRAHTKSTIPRLVIVGDYAMNGSVLFFPINGHGPMNLTLFNGIYEYDFEWMMETRKGEEYVKLVNSSYDYDIEGVHYDFKNLFGGDEALSAIINQALNDNWKIVNEDLKKSILKTLLIIHDNIFRKIFSKIPFSELFLD